MWAKASALCAASGWGASMRQPHGDSAMHGDPRSLLCEGGWGGGDAAVGELALCFQLGLRAEHRSEQRSKELADLAALPLGGAGRAGSAFRQARRRRPGRCVCRAGPRRLPICPGSWVGEGRELCIISFLQRRGVHMPSHNQCFSSVSGSNPPCHRGALGVTHLLGVCHLQPRWHLFREGQW